MASESKSNIKIVLGAMTLGNEGKSPVLRVNPLNNMLTNNHVFRG